MKLRICVMALLLSACAGSHSSPTVKQVNTPAEFTSACGHPGATVSLTKVPVTVRHADCDLTGVVIAYKGTKATVPHKGETVTANIDGASSLEVSADADDNVTVAQP